jgi:predicted permease
LVGYGARKIGVLSQKDEPVINSILINIALPSFIFVNTIGKPLNMAMIKTPGLAILVEALVVVLAYFIGRALRLDRQTTGALMIVAAFGNTGYMGYPVAQAAFPHDKHGVLTAVLFDNFGMRLGLITAGVAIATSSAGARFEWSSLTQFVKTPLFPAMLLGLLLRTAHLPPLMMNSLGYLAAATVPLSMLSIGLNISAASLREYPAPLVAVVLLKMAIFPAVMWFLLQAAGVHGNVAKAAMLESAMPSAVFSGVVVSRFGSNGRFAAAAIFLTTLLSAVVIPGLLRLMS